MSIKARQSLLAESEATYGTDPTPGGTDAVIVIDDLTINVIEESADLDHVDAGLDGFEHVAGTLMYEVSFTTPLRGSGAAGTAPDIAPLIKACGFSETIVAATSVTYAPASVFDAATGYQSATFYIQDGTLQYQAHGCYGTFGLVAAAASFPKLAFTFQGLYEKPTDLASITAPTYDTTRPAPCRGMTFSIGGSSPRMSAFSLDLNRETHVVRDMAATLGVRAVELGRCKPSGAFTIQEQTIATIDHWARLDTPTNLAWSFAFGGSAGNICTIGRPAANTSGGLKYRVLSQGEDNGVISHEIGYTLGRHSLNDTLQLVFT